MIGTGSLGGWARLGIVLTVIWSLTVGSTLLIEYREVSAERADNLSLPPPPKGFVIEPKATPYFFTWRPVDLLAPGPAGYVRDFEPNNPRFLTILLVPLAVLWAFGWTVGWVLKGFRQSRRSPTK